MTYISSLAFNLAEHLQIKHRFNKEEGLAGWDWLWGFLKRHPRLSIRKEENLSVARAIGMKREEVYNYVDLLEEMLARFNLINKPNRVFGLDESGFQLNTRAKEVVAPKGDRVVHGIAPKDKGETVSIIGCFNTAGSYLPPGSEVFMNGKSAYATGLIFHEVLKHFVSYFRVTKDDPVLLMLDGHDSHCSYPEALDYAAENGVHMLCFPPYTTNWLQPADKSFFGPLKKAYYDAASKKVCEATPKSIYEN